MIEIDGKVYYQVSEVASILKVSNPTIIKMRRDGRLPASIKKSEKVFLYEKERVDTFSKSFCPLNRKTTEMFKKEIYEKFGGEYEILGEYVKNNVKIKVKHTTCNHIWETRPNDLLSNGHGCPRCKSGSSKYRIQNFEKDRSYNYNKENYKQIVGSRYVVLNIDEYENNKTILKVKCTRCNNEFQNIAYNFFKNLLDNPNTEKCDICRLRYKFNNAKEFEEYLYKSTSEKFKIENYVNKETVCNITHLNCGNVYYYKPRTFIEKKIKCPVCMKTYGMSEGEKELANFIRENYKGEIMIKALKIIPNFELDIYLPKLGIALEYNGLYWHRAEKIIDRKSYSNLDYHRFKTLECSKKDIRLITILDVDWQRNKDIIKDKILKIITDKNYYEIEDLKFVDLNYGINNKFLNDKNLLPDIKPRKILQGFNKKNISTYYDCGRLEIKEDVILGRLRKTHEQFLAELKDLHGDEYTLLTKYESSNKKIKIRHNLCSYEWESTPNHLTSNKVQCPSCSCKALKTTESYKREIEKKTNKEYTIISEYESSASRIKYKHNKNNCEFENKPNNFFKLKKCPICKETMNFTNKKSKFIDYKGVMKVNYYFPKQKVVVLIIDPQRVNLKYKKDAKYLQNIKDIINNNGDRLLLFYSDELRNKKDIVECKINYILGRSKKQKIYARNCTVRPLLDNKTDLKLKKDLLDECHIQGSDCANIKLGLFYHNTLVSVMTFVSLNSRVALGRNKNNSKEYDYELSRFVSSKEYTVVGGFSKLLKYFERNYEWEKLITFADKRYSNGDMYLKNKWSLIRESKASYYYINTNDKNANREYRFKYKKSSLEKLFPLSYDKNKSEKIIMQENGYYQVFNLGQLVFEYKKRN